MFEPPNPNYVFSQENFESFVDMSPFQCCCCMAAKYRISCHNLKCVNIQQTRSLQISKELCILRENEKVFYLLGWSGLQKITCKLPSFNNCGAFFPVGKISNFRRCKRAHNAMRLEHVFGPN